MSLRIQCWCIDTTDPDRLAAFWQAALGWRRTLRLEGLGAPGGSMSCRPT